MSWWSKSGRGLLTTDYTDFHGLFLWKKAFRVCIFALIGYLVSMQANVDAAQVQKPQPTVYQTTGSTPSPKPVVKPTPPSLTLPTLNSPQSAQFQPLTSTTPSYSPRQPDLVVETRNNVREQENQKAVAVKAQQSQQPLQVADQHMASSVLTGEYTSNATTRHGNPQVGGYISLSV
jgi:cytoskeletal protein RodZ